MYRYDFIMVKNLKFNVPKCHIAFHDSPCRIIIYIWFGQKEGDRDLNNQKLHVLINSKNVTFLLCLFVFLPIREFFIHMETSLPVKGCII